MKLTIRLTVSLSSLRSPRLAVSVYLIVHAKFSPHILSIMDLFLSLPDPLKYFVGQVVVLNVIHATVD